MAKQFFTSRGWSCPPRQTTADFLTSLTNPAERVPLPEWEDKVPRTPDEFAKQWKESEERKRLVSEIEEYERDYPVGGEWEEKFRISRVRQQARHMCVFPFLFFALAALAPPASPLSPQT